METAKLKKFAQHARRSLREQVSAKLKLVLAEGSAARREQPKVVAELEKAISASSREQLVERVAYTWFNRFCALRFMDANRYTRIGVVSPAEGQFQPEILAEAKMGHIDEEMVGDKTRQQIFALLDGKVRSHDPQGEAYQLLVVAACNDWHRAMPFLFERIEDYTELLMPDDLLSGNSILAYTREAMTTEACQDVEVIGWLYQFYISEKKDEVFDGLKKNKKITPENIPAATQLFTPHWIVRYLVENSLGRLWLLNRPNSKLVDRMDYYIKPEQVETDFLRINTPEEIKICDPACGSGHMLTYAFDLLYAIYEEEGYEPAEIPEKILTHNLYGIEIDERAGELAAFALTMKARAKQRRFFNKGIKPNICVLENVQFNEGEIDEYMTFIGRDLFTAPLQTTLQQFEEADNFGSLIRPEVTDVAEMTQTLEAKDVSGQLFFTETHNKVLQALRQADYLSPKYHVVIANPPYMGAGGMNSRLKEWAAASYSNSKQDAYTMFVERCLKLVVSKGYAALITIQNWMYQSVFENFRTGLLSLGNISGLIQIGYNTFPELNSKKALGSAFVVFVGQEEFKGDYLNLNDVAQSADKEEVFLDKKTRRSIYRVSSDYFSSVPSSTICYQASERSLVNFAKFPPLSKVGALATGLIAGDNDMFVRCWHEVSLEKSTLSGGDVWRPLLKGGDKRKWYGNTDLIVEYRQDGSKLRAHPKAMMRNERRYFQRGIHWNRVSQGSFFSRLSPPGFIFEDLSPSFFPEDSESKALSFLNSKVAQHYLLFLSAGWKVEIGQVGGIPAATAFWDGRLEAHGDALIELAKFDWSTFETSWEFTNLFLLNPEYRQSTLKSTYQKLRAHWQEMTLEMQQLEEENNRIFIDAYGLQDELTPEVPLKEITLTCNPHYRYGGDKSEEELEALLLADTMRELVSYAVGCMFGRYALEKPGLVLANQGETMEDYLQQIPAPSFPADDDNVIPMLDGDWFTDDIAERFRSFLRITFGEAHYEENLAFIEQGLNIKGKRNYSIRDYFLGEFYTDHVKRYKKRPIYWLFSSPKGSFNALIYMHRYQPYTVGTVLEYLRDFKNEKLRARKNHLEAVSISANSSQADKTKALKEIEQINKIIAELDDYERDILYPLATEQLEIDLDDGVKTNYPKFGAALKKIVGLEAKED